MEFAAATVVFSRANEKSQYEVDCDDNGENGVDGDDVGGDGGEDGDGSGEDGNDTDDDGITNGEVETQVVALLQGSHKKLFPYYKHCVDQRHKHFLWTGPKLQILPRSDDIAATISHTSRGEVLDLPSHPIYRVDADQSPVTNTTEAHVEQPVAMKGRSLTSVTSRSLTVQERTLVAMEGKGKSQTLRVPFRGSFLYAEVL